MRLLRSLSGRAPLLTANRYTDLQPVGMGAFGLVWYLLINVMFPAQMLIPRQLCERSAHRPICGGQEDHEAVQHSGIVKEDVQRAKALEALAP